MLQKPLHALQQGWENRQRGGGVGPAELGSCHRAVFHHCTLQSAGRVWGCWTARHLPALLPFAAAVWRGFSRSCLSFPTCKVQLFADGSVSCCTPKLSCAGEGGHPLWDVNTQAPAVVTPRCCAAPGLPECLQTWRSHPLPAQRCRVMCPCIQAAISCCGELTF